MRHPALWLPLLTLLLHGCGGGDTIRDGRPDYYRNVADIPNAVPRVEPISRANQRPYTVFGRCYTPLRSSRGYDQVGVASWYGSKFHGRRTADGEIYHVYGMTAAHKTLPLPTYVQVRNLKNDRSVVVKVNDRGPFHANRLIDLSYAAAAKLGMLRKGTALVEVRAIDPRHPNRVLDAPPKAPLIAPGQAPRIYLQVGAFSIHGNATRLSDRLRMHLRRPVRIDTGPDHLYRVQIGPLTSVDSADQVSRQLRALAIRGTRLLLR